MPSLELKIPPPVVALVIALAMWFAARSAAPESEPARSVLTLVMVGIGLAFDGAALVAFWRARTTINPMRPASSSAMVTRGVYRLTRNPMYVGLVFFLCAWAAHLWSMWALLGPAVFVTWITRFQILPEEKALKTLFGAQYDEYRAKVRRWL